MLYLDCHQKCSILYSRITRTRNNTANFQPRVRFRVRIFPSLFSFFYLSITASSYPHYSPWTNALREGWKYTGTSSSCKMFHRIPWHRSRRVYNIWGKRSRAWRNVKHARVSPQVFGTRCREMGDRSPTLQCSIHIPFSKYINRCELTGIVSRESTGKVDSERIAVEIGSYLVESCNVAVAAKSSYTNWYSHFDSFTS